MTVTKKIADNRFISFLRHKILYFISWNVAFKGLLEPAATQRFIPIYMVIVALAIFLSKRLTHFTGAENIPKVAIILGGLIFYCQSVKQKYLIYLYQNRQLRIYKNYLPVIDELIDELRIKQHEFDNHLQALNMMVACQDNRGVFTDSVKDYIKDLTEESHWSDLIKLDNKILAGFLYSKSKVAKKENIDFKFKIYDYGFTSGLQDYELIEVVGNLIDNAFEAAGDAGRVFLEIGKEEAGHYLLVKNKHSYVKAESINKMFQWNYSTKGDPHKGFGLSNVKALMKKYNGAIEVFNEQVDAANYLVFKIIFPPLSLNK